MPCPNNPISRAASRANRGPTNRRAPRPRSTRLALVDPPRGQAVEERWSFAKSPGTAAQGPVDGSGLQEGIRAGPQQEDLGFPRREKSSDDEGPNRHRAAPQPIRQRRPVCAPGRHGILPPSWASIFWPTTGKPSKRRSPPTTKLSSMARRAPKRRRKRCADHACLGSAGTPG